MSESANRHPLEEDLHAYLDGELSDLEIEKLERHLQLCSMCSNKFESIKVLFSQIDGLVESPMDVDLVPLVLKSIEPRSLQTTGLGWLLGFQLAAFGIVAIALSRPLLAQFENLFALGQVWLGQSGFEAELVIMIQKIQAVITQLRLEIPGGIDLSIPQLFSPSPETAWVLIALGACLVWLLANRWLLDHSFRQEV